MLALAVTEAGDFGTGTKLHSWTFSFSAQGVSPLGFYTDKQSGATRTASPPATCAVSCISGVRRLVMGWWWSNPALRRRAA
jgi:hypothetical protein